MSFSESRVSAPHNLIDLLGHNYIHSSLTIGITMVYTLGRVQMRSLPQNCLKHFQQFHDMKMSYLGTFEDCLCDQTSLLYQKNSDRP